MIVLCCVTVCSYCVIQEQGCVDPLEPEELQQSINLANQEALCSNNSRSLPVSSSVSVPVSYYVYMAAQFDV